MIDDEQLIDALLTFIALRYTGYRLHRPNTPPLKALHYSWLDITGHCRCETFTAGITAAHGCTLCTSITMPYDNGRLIHPPGARCAGILRVSRTVADYSTTEPRCPVCKVELIDPVADHRQLSDDAINARWRRDRPTPAQILALSHQRPSSAQTTPHPTPNPSPAPDALENP